jgi:hypothetical protein
MNPSTFGRERSRMPASCAKPASRPSSQLGPEPRSTSGSNPSLWACATSALPCARRNPETTYTRRRRSRVRRHALLSLILDGAKQVFFDVVVHDRAEMSGVQVVLDKAVLRVPFVSSTRYLPAIRKSLAIRSQVEIKETRLTRSKEATLVPLDVLVVLVF